MRVISIYWKTGSIPVVYDSSNDSCSSEVRGAISNNKMRRSMSLDLSSYDAAVSNLIFLCR